tara:strand:+ start:666 stop:938 length:273 start_codon:yes stop_codon:yes gene_type:complete
MEQKEYEALENMFVSDGWKYFTESLDEIEKSLTTSAPEGAITNDQWQLARGRILQLRNILGFEDLVKFNQQQQELEALQATEDTVNVDLI